MPIWTKSIATIASMNVSLPMEIRIELLKRKVRSSIIKSYTGHSKCEQCMAGMTVGDKYNRDQLILLLQHLVKLTWNVRSHTQGEHYKNGHLRVQCRLGCKSYLVSRSPNLWIIIFHLPMCIHTLSLGNYIVGNLTL